MKKSMLSLVLVSALLPVVAAATTGGCRLSCGETGNWKWSCADGTFTSCSNTVSGRVVCITVDAEGNVSVSSEDTPC